MGDPWQQLETLLQRLTCGEVPWLSPQVQDWATHHLGTFPPHIVAAVLVELDRSLLTACSAQLAGDALLLAALVHGVEGRRLTPQDAADLLCKDEIGALGFRDADEVLRYFTGRWGQ